jgi:hypothetical protein
MPTREQISDLANYYWKQNKARKLPEWENTADGNWFLAEATLINLANQYGDQ